MSDGTPLPPDISHSGHNIQTEKLIEQTFRFRLRTIFCLLCNFVPNASIFTLSEASCLLSSNICASVSSNFWISAFTLSFFSCWYFPIENLGFLLLAANGGLKTPWFIFAKRRQKRRINTYVMNTEIELTSYHFRFFIKVRYTPKKSPKKMITWNPRHSHLALHFGLLSYHFFLFHRARIHLIAHRQKANEFNSPKVTAKTTLLVPVSQNIG